MTYHRFEYHEYKGYKYQPEEDIEPDNIKIFHDVITPEGERISLGFSPYSVPTKESFEKWIDLGCPKRGNSLFDHAQGLRNEDITKAWNKRSIRFIREGNNE